MDWDELRFWETGEWQVIDEQLGLLDKAKIPWCPGRKNLWTAMDKTPLEEVRVVICGQDPYPNPELATGLAFSIPKEIKRNKFPPTLVNILRELQTDLGLPEYDHGDLSAWCKEGVLLWNVLPSCLAHVSGSHNFPEYQFLTQEVFSEISKRGAVFAFLGQKAKDHMKYVDPASSCLWTSHPSPLGASKGPRPFQGSRIFSEINLLSKKLGNGVIDWRLG